MGLSCSGAISGLGWDGMGWDLCAGLFYEHRFAMLIIPDVKSNMFFFAPYISFWSIPALVRTYCYDTTVADSACSATSYLCGVESKNT